MIRFVISALFLLIGPGSVIAQQRSAADEVTIIRSKDVFHPVRSQNGMVVTQHFPATEAGLAVLKEGGNAIDAAVTVGFTLAVTLPRAGNIGGGGFMLLHLAEENKTLAIDYREKAPKAATMDMFLDKEGNVDNYKSRFSYLSVGVPGTVAALCMVLEKYGTISLARALKPAIELAEKGFVVDNSFADAFHEVKDRLARDPHTKAAFFKSDGTPHKPGETLVQADLAWTLKQIAAHGADAFYKGKVGKRLIAAIQAGGGIMTMEDLAAYKPAIREPVRGTYRGYEILSMPPSSSGGVHLIQMMNLLEQADLKSLGHNRAETVHLMTEAMRLAYADRFKHMGDTDFVKVPINELTSKAYAKALFKGIDRSKARPSSSVIPNDPRLFRESHDTTHFSIADKHGNVVSNTYTLNLSFGSGLVAKGTGIVLNDEMDDFTAKPGARNAFQLVGGEKNAIEPEKRMLSSMTPVLVFKDGKPYLSTGSPGGSLIITATMQVLLNVIDHGMNIAGATAAPRLHHQWFPDKLFVEQHFNGDTAALLEAKGHDVNFMRNMGSTQSILINNGYFFGAADTRRPGALAKGY